jgi:hypothetical protein
MMAKPKMIVLSSLRPFFKKNWVLTDLTLHSPNFGHPLIFYSYD